MPKEKLTETASLLSDLKTSQYQRLSTGVLAGKGISTKEQEIGWCSKTFCCRVLMYPSPLPVPRKQLSVQSQL